jgi:hypothetical protein
MLARPALARRRVVPAPVATQRLVAPAVVKPILPPKLKLRHVQRPVAKPFMRSPGPTQRPLVPAPPVTRMGARPVAPPVLTERRAAKTLVRPVAPPVPKLRHVQRPVAKPLMTVPPTVKLSRVVAAAAPSIAVATVPAISRPAVVPTILPPQPTVRMNLRTGTPIVDAGADPRRLIRYVTPAAADFLTEYEDTVAGGTPHGFLRLVRSQYAGARGGRRGYGYAGNLDATPKYKVTNTGLVWRYNYFNPSSANDVTVVFDARVGETEYAYSAGSKDADQVKSVTVSSFNTYADAESAARTQYDKYKGAVGWSSDTTPSTTGVVAGSSASGTITQTGYYKDTGGWAWYYNATSDYLEAIAAPKGKYSTQPKFTSSTSGFATMKANIAKSGTIPTSRSAAIANATVDGGVELPQSSRSSSGGGSVQTQAPADKLAAAGGDGFFSNLTSQVWFWPAAILVPTAAIIAGILLIPSKKKAAPAAAPAATPTLVPA